MVKDCISSSILKDGSLIPAENVSVPTDAVVIYDVLRVMDGVPLFLEDHSFTNSGRFDARSLKPGRTLIPAQ